MKLLLSCAAAFSLAALSITFSGLKAQDQPPPPPDNGGNYDGGQPPPPDNGQDMNNDQDNGQAPDNGPSDDNGGGNNDSGNDVSYQTFYDNLSNDGQWIQTDDYGYVFQPSAVQDPNWAPYTEGHWVYSDAGWVWVSDEPWGWATYHYGRWANIDGTGWCWVPGYQWAPAWVSWRYGGGYAGWAPLPPGAFYGGASFHFGGDVDAQFGIGIGFYNFVPVGNLGYDNYRGYYVNRGNNVTIYNRTTNITNINVGSRFGTRGAGAFRGVRAGGPPLAQVNAHSAHPVRTVQLTSAGGAGRSQMSGNSLAIYAPHMNKANGHQARPPQVARTIGHAKLSNGAGRSMGNNAGRNGVNNQGRTPTTEYQRPATQAGTTPTSTRHHKTQQPGYGNEGNGYNRQGTTEENNGVNRQRTTGENNGVNRERTPGEGNGSYRQPGNTTMEDRTPATERPHAEHRETTERQPNSSNERPQGSAGGQQNRGGPGSATEHQNRPVEHTQAAPKPAPAATGTEKNDKKQS